MDQNHGFEKLRGLKSQFSLLFFKQNSMLTAHWKYINQKEEELKNKTWGDMNQTHEAREQTKYGETLRTEERKGENAQMEALCRF